MYDSARQCLVFRLLGLKILEQSASRGIKNFLCTWRLTLSLPSLAARAAKGGKPAKGARQQNGRPQRGRQFDRHSGTGIV